MSKATGHRYPGLGSIFVAPDTWFTGLGSIFAAQGTRFPGLGLIFIAPGTWFTGLKPVFIASVTHATGCATRPKFTQRSGVNFGLALLVDVNWNATIV